MPSQSHEHMLTLRESADLLNISKDTLRRWIKSGELPAYRVGPRAIRIRRSDLTRLTFAAPLGKAK
jgi:excisionase family DNA binding protein